MSQEKRTKTNQESGDAPRRRRRRRGGRGRGGRGRRQEAAPVAEASAPSEEPAREVSMPTLAVTEAEPAADTATIPSAGTPIAAEPTAGDRADETAHEVAALAEQIAADSRVDERPELFAQRLQEPGAEGLVHWRRHAKREFRYVLKESFD